MYCNILYDGLAAYTVFDNILPDKNVAWIILSSICVARIYC